MKLRNTNDQPDIKETIIAEGVKVRGNVTVEANIWLDGVVDGSVHTKGEVSLGKSGKINGNVSGTIVLVGGAITGNVKASVKLIVLSSGKILGDVDTSGLAVEEGGTIIGNLRMPEPIEETNEGTEAS